MTRDNRISIYINDQTEKEVKRNADEADMAVSAYINKLIQRQLRQERENEVSSQSRAVENIQRQIDEGTRQLRDVADDVKDTNAKTGAYAVAAFDLIEREYSDKVVDNALKRGAATVHENEKRLAELQEDAEEHETNGGDDEYDPFNPDFGDN